MIFLRSTPLSPINSLKITYQSLLTEFSNLKKKITLYLDIIIITCHNESLKKSKKTFSKIQNVDSGNHREVHRKEKKTF